MKSPETAQDLASLYLVKLRPKPLQRDMILIHVYRCAEQVISHQPLASPTAAFWHEMCKRWLEIDSSSEVGSWGEHIYKIIAVICRDIAQHDTMGQCMTKTNDIGLFA